jgi:hypothetical protein
MEVIVSSIKDLLKYNVIQYVNTGDKTVDNLLNALFIAILTYMFSGKLTSFFYIQWTKYKYGSSLLNRNIHAYYTEKINSKEITLQSCTWANYTETVFERKLNSYFIDNFGWSLWSNTKIYNMGNDIHEMKRARNPYISGIGDIQTLLKDNNEIFPIFQNKNGLLGLKYIYTSSSYYPVCIVYENDNVLKDFYNILDKIDIEIKEKEEILKPTVKKIISVKNHLKNNKYEVFPDRTFNKFVSRHKENIIQSLKDFETALEGTSLFNGFGSYNLGIMLHGIPGTGKTSVIKAVCNYLQRDGLIIDMRKIITSSELEIIFNQNNVKNTVFILEEFDCVQGVIERSLIKNDNKPDLHEVERKELTERHMKLLQMPNTNSVTSEIESINSKLDNLQDCLTIDALLTVLDGMVEVRGRCIIATTNYIDRIDKALIREGRFDYKINLGAFNNEEIKDLLTIMFKNSATKKEFNHLKKAFFCEGEFTPAKIIHLCHKYRNLSNVIDHMS